MSQSTPGKKSSAAWRELGCGLVTVIVFMLPLFAFSLASRGPALFVRVVVILALVLLAVVAYRRLARLLRRMRGL